MATRARKAGDAAGIESKNELKYDQELAAGTQQRLIDWIKAVLGGDAGDGPGGTSADKIGPWLKDGVVLGRFINKLLEADGKPKVAVKAKATQTFAAMGNLENFIAGCRAYGVAETALFQTVDCYEGRKGPLLNVINCLSQLAFTANEKGFTPKCE